MEPLRAVEQRGGVARWAELQRVGVSREALLAAVHRGELVRPHRGCYSLPGADRERVLASVFRATPTCLTWCASHGLPLLTEDERIHLGVPQPRALGDPRSRPVDEVVIHRHLPTRGALARQHLDIVGLCTTPLEQVALWDAAINRGLVRSEESLLLTRGTEQRRSRVIGAIDGRAQSPLETVARVALREAGFSVTPQVLLPGVGRVDLLVEGRVVVETDGYAFHHDREQFARDRKRDRALELSGYAVLRYTSADVLQSASGVVDDVIGVMWRRGWLTPTVRTNLDAAARVSRFGWRDRPGCCG